MLSIGHYIFKQADTQEEFDQIHRLNYRTFVGEIPQHPDTGTGVLIDKFHDKNSYWIVLRDGRVVGMVSAHDRPPFSIASRLPDPEILQRPGTRPLEVRLLALEPSERNSTLFFGLVWKIYEDARRRGYTHFFISGVEERRALYERLGFEALGPAVRSGSASFIPMMLELQELPEPLLRVKRLWESHVGKVQPGHAGDGNGSRVHGAEQAPPTPVCLLPGPVTTSTAVRAAFHQAPIYHRGVEFIRRFMRVRELLGEIVGGRDVALLNGSGTLANEAIAATLAAERRQGLCRGCGILLINGEFGERLARQATRFGLEPRLLTWPWGEPWDLAEVETALSGDEAGTWVWGVHQESSTGVLNDLPGLIRVAKRHGARVCVDCISSLGAAPLDLSEVYLASGASGKSLGAVAGAALIFADRAALHRLDRTQVPSYFDIAAALASEGPCYTFPSPTLLALEAALQEYATPQKAQTSYARYHDLGVRVRHQLRRLGLTPLAAEEVAAPVVTTFAPPQNETATSFVGRCRAWGFAIGGESAYLAQRRLVQIATMGAVTRDMMAPLFDLLEQWLAQRPALAVAQ